MVNQIKRLTCIEQIVGIQTNAENPFSEQWETISEMSNRQDEAYQKYLDFFEDPEKNIANDREELNVIVDRMRLEPFDQFCEKPKPRILEYQDPLCTAKILHKVAEPDVLVKMIGEEPKHPESRFVQIQHPNTKEWCLMDREKGLITEQSNKPYEDAPKIAVKDF